MKKIVIFIVYILISTSIYSQTLKELMNDIDNSEKLTYGFLDKLIKHWSIIHTDTTLNIKKEILYSKFLASQKLEKSERLSIIISGLNNNISTIYADKGVHKIYFDFPIVYQNKKQKIKFELVRKNYKNRKVWIINDIIINTKKLSENIGINEVEFEKGFSGMISEMKDNISLTKYFNINVFFRWYNEEYQNITINDNSYNINLEYRITDIPYYNSINKLIGYKYIIFIKDTANKKSRKHGWHILDEGEMDFFYKTYDKNNKVLNFYLK